MLFLILLVKSHFPTLRRGPCLTPPSPHLAPLHVPGTPMSRNEPRGGCAACLPGSALMELSMLYGSQQGPDNSILEMQLSWPTWTGFCLFSSFPCFI